MGSKPLLPHAMGQNWGSAGCGSCSEGFREPGEGGDAGGPRGPRLARVLSTTS